MATTESITTIIAEVSELAKSWQGSDLEHQHRDTKLWPIAASSAAFVEALVMLHQPINIVELGTSGGYSTLHLARAALQYGGHIHTVEHDRQKFALAKLHFDKAGVTETVTAHEGDILQVLQVANLPATFDLVFIDAEKANYKKYFDAFAGRLQKNSLIIADNVMSHRRQVDDFYSHMITDSRFITYAWNFDAGLLISKYVPN